MDGLAVLAEYINDRTVLTSYVPGVNVNGTLNNDRLNFPASLVQQLKN